MQITDPALHFCHHSVPVNVRLDKTVQNCIPFRKLCTFKTDVECLYLAENISDLT